GKGDGARESGGAGRSGRQFFHDVSHRRDVSDRSAAEQSDAARGLAHRPQTARLESSSSRSPLEKRRRSASGSAGVDSDRRKKDIPAGWRPAGISLASLPSGRQRLRIERRALLRAWLRARPSEAVTAIDVNVGDAFTASFLRTGTRVPLPRA